MVYREDIRLRLSPDEKELVGILAQRHGLSIQAYCKSSILRGDPDKRVMALYNKVVKYKALMTKSMDFKKKSWFLYVDRNAAQRIYMAAKGSLYLTGKINMEEIRYIIKEFTEIYDLLPVELQEIKKDSFKEIKNMGVKSYLMDKIKAVEHDTQKGKHSMKVLIDVQEKRVKEARKNGNKKRDPTK